MTARKTPAKPPPTKRTKRQAKTQAVVPTLKPQPNGGALWAGPPANPVAGPGRPANALREAMRGNLADVIPKLHQQWIDGKIDGIQYAQLLAKYTLDDRTKGLAWGEAMALAEELATIVREEVAPEHYTPRLAARLTDAARRRMPSAE